MPKIQLKEQEKTEIVVSARNVYADVGFPPPEEALAKVGLAMLITLITKRKKQTQKKPRNSAALINLRFLLSFAVSFLVLRLTVYLDF